MKKKGKKVEREDGRVGRRLKEGVRTGRKKKKKKKKKKKNIWGKIV